jgi:hypothetical protein
MRLVVRISALGGKYSTQPISWILAVIRRTVESPALRHLALRQSAYSGGLVLAHYAIIAGHLWAAALILSQTTDR